MDWIEASRKSRVLWALALTAELLVGGLGFGLLVENRSSDGTAIWIGGGIALTLTTLFWALALFPARFFPLKRDPYPAPDQELATARQLAERIAARLPRKTFWRSVSGSIVPTLSSGDHGREHCPICGRHLPCSLGPIAGGGAFAGSMAMPRSDRELIATCLVDGPRSRHARSFTESELIEAGRVVADAFEQNGWHRWARLFHLADIEAVGQAFEALHAYGPFAFEPVDMGAPASPHFYVLAQRDLDVLAVSTAQYWPQYRNESSHM